MAYQSIFSGGKLALPSQASTITSGFVPGQYAKINAQIAAAQPKAPPTPKVPMGKPSTLGRALTDIGHAGKAVGSATVNAGRAVVRPVSDIVQGKGGAAVHAGAQLGSDLTGGTANYLASNDIVSPIKQNVALATGNQAAYRNAFVNENKQLGLGPNGRNIKNALVKLAGNTAQAGSLVIGGPEAAGIKNIGKQGIEDLVKTSAKTGLAGALGNAGNTLANNPSASGKQVVKSAVIGADVGAAGPLLGKGVSKIIGAVKGAIKGTPEAASEVAPKAATQTAKDYFANEPKATADYQKHTMEEFGTSKPNIVSADSAKHIVNGVGAKLEPNQSVPYHEAASAFSKQYYQKLLDDPTTKDQPVLFTAGGSGVGKTHGLTSAGNLDKYAAIVDTNTPTVAKVGKALDTGRSVKINYVYRDPIDAFRNGVLSRAEKTGRTVPTDVHVSTHTGSLAGIQKLAAHYKDNPNVKISILDNSGDKIREVPLDFLADKGYNKGELQGKLNEQLNQAHNQKEISSETYHASQSSIPTDNGRNGSRVAEETRPSSPGEGSESSQLGASKVGKSIQTQAVKRGLENTFGDSAQYEKINIADQAKRAVDLTNNRGELDKVISGENPLPKGLRATALIKAVEEHPTLGKDPELLNRLSQAQHLVGESSRSAQELRLAAERDSDSPVAKIQELRQTREATVAKRLKTPVTTAVKNTVKEIKDTVPKTSRQDWHSFVESLKC